MKNNIKTIQKKIFTINKIYKITKVMKLIAAINLKKALHQLSDSGNCQELVLDIFSKLNFLVLNNEVVQNVKSSQIKTKKTKLWIIFGSDLGLCGSFNTKIFKIIKKNISQDDALILIGKKMTNYFSNFAFSILQKYLNLNFNNENISSLVAFLIKNSKNFSKISVIYTKYSKSLSINVLIKQLLPIETDQLLNKSKILSTFIIENNPQFVYQNTLFLYLKNLLLIWDSRASEEKTRQLAMENASDNSEDIIKDLKLKYNQFRQEKITKEILLVSQEE